MESLTCIVTGIQFTSSNCTNDYLLASIQSCATIINTKFRTICSWPPKETQYPIAVTPHLPLSPLTALDKLLSYFLSLWIYLFWTFHINGIRICGLLCLACLRSMFSRFIYVIAGVSNSILLLPRNIPLYGYAVFCLSRYSWWMFVWFPHFWKLWIMLLWTFVNKLCGHFISFWNSGSYGHCLPFWGTVKTVFQSVRTILGSHQQCIRIPIFPHTH